MQFRIGNQVAIFLTGLIALISAVGSAAAIAKTDAPASLPDWQPESICEHDSAALQCRFFEWRARGDVSASWHLIPTPVRQTCLMRIRPSLEASWRILGDCIEIEGRRAQLVGIEAQRKREKVQIKKLAQANTATKSEISGATQAGSASEPETATANQPDRASGQTAAEAERARIAAEEESFMKTLEAQRAADAEAARNRAAEKKAAAERAAEAERARIAAEEESFMKTLEAQRAADAAAAEKRAAEKKA